MKTPLLEFKKQVIGELNITLINLIDEQDQPTGSGKGPAQGARLDIILNIVDITTAEAGIIQALDRVIGVETVAGLGG